MPTNVEALPVTDWTAFQLPSRTAILVLLANLALGGLLAIYVRFLYRRSAPQVTGDSISKVFPLLTMITIALIAAVKSSLAVSLGLFGALSIVRFRAAIKDPEELVYLFLCIGVGVSVGAGQPWLALALVGIASVFVLLIDRVGRGPRGLGSAYVTVAGEALSFAGGSERLLEELARSCPGFVIQRCEVDEQEGQLRVHLPQASADLGPKLVTALRQHAPGCHVSFVNADTLP